MVRRAWNRTREGAAFLYTLLYKSQLSGESLRKPLTSLRAFAVFFVFVTHLRFLYAGASFFDFHETYMGNGDICVTFFFVLSGLVFSLGYGDRFERLTLRDWGSFILRRLKKTYPLYITTVLIMLSWQAIGFPNFTLYVRGEAFRLALAATLTQTFNPTLGTSMIYNAAGWYLSAAFGIYLVTPLLLRLNHFVRERPWATRVLLVLAFAAHAAYEAHLVFGGYSEIVRSELGYFHPAGRVIQFIAGIMLGNLVLQAERGMRAVPLRDDPVVAGGLELAALILWVAAFVSMPSLARLCVYKGAPLGFEYVVSYPVHLLVSAFLVWVFAHGAGAVSRVLSARLPVELGKVSFEFFLIHWVIIHIFGSYLVGAEFSLRILFIEAFMLMASLAFSVLWHWLGELIRPSRPEALPAAANPLPGTLETSPEQGFIRIDN